MSDLTASPDEVAGCVSDLRLDRLLAGELGADECSALEAHLVRCVTCRARHTELARQWQRFAADGPDFPTLADQVQRRRALRDRRERAAARAAMVLGGLALAAGALLVFVPTAQMPAPSATRSKGKPEIGYFLKRGESVTEGVPGFALHPGDRIRFVTSSERPRYLALLNQDGRGVSVYYPATADAARVPAGGGVPLGFSVELDDYLGRERVFALFCDQPFAIEPVRAALQTRGAVPVPAGCSLASLELEKEPAP